MDIILVHLCKMSINLSARVNNAFGLAKISNLVIGNARWPTLQNNVLT